MWFVFGLISPIVVLHTCYALHQPLHDKHWWPHPKDTQIPFHEPLPDDLGRSSPAVSLPTPANATRSFWLDLGGPLAEEGSTGDLTQEADVCIIGSGITGVSVAWHVSQMMREHGDGSKMMSIVILEAREFCSGATGRNGGHLLPNAFSGFIARKTTFNTSEAIKSYVLEQHNSRGLLKFLKDRNLQDDVDLSEGGHVKLFETLDEEIAERQDFEAAQKAGLDLTAVRWIDNQEFVEKYGLNPNLNYTGVWVPGHNLWPCKLVGELYKDARGTSSSGNVSVSLHTKTPATSISRRRRHPSHQRPWTVHTPRGQIKCTYVVHATNGYAGHLLPFFACSTTKESSGGSSSNKTSRSDILAITPTRGQVAAVRASVPASDLRWRFGWHSSGGWEYWLPRFQKLEGTPLERTDFPLIILGGARQHSGGPNIEAGVTDDGVLNERVTESLKAFLPRYFPDMFRQSEMGVRWEMEWTGIMGFTKTRDPFVGPVFDPDHLSSPNQPNAYEGQYIAAGYTGHGMARAFACAEAIASMLKAQITGEKWIMPKWLPERYLTWVMRQH